MRGSESRNRRRLLITLNLGSLLCLEVLYYGWIAGGDHNRVAGALMVLCGIILVVTFVQVIWRTRLWSLTHAKTGQLDERQTVVTREAIRLSFVIFVPCSLLVMFGAAVAANHELWFFDAVLPAGLLYLAHVLPGAIVGWRETIV